MATLVLATLTPAMAQPFADVPTNHWAYDAIAELAAKGLVEGFPDGTFKGKQPVSRYEMAMVIARIIARIEAIPTPPPLPANLVRQPALAAATARINANNVAITGLTTRVNASAQNIALLQRLVNEFRAELQALGVRVTALEEELNAVKGRLDNTKITGNFLYFYESAATSPSSTITDNNAQNVTTTAGGRLSQARVRLLIDGRVDPNTNVFTQLRFRYNQGNAPTANNSFVLTVERMYLNHNNLLGFSGLNMRLGRDVVRLGNAGAISLGLLLDSSYYNDNRDGVQFWLPAMGPIRIHAGVLHNRSDSANNVYAYFARGTMALFPGATLGLNYRSDASGTAAAAGTCPSAQCLTGSGFGADVAATVLNGFDLSLAYATYTRTGSTAANYFAALAKFDLQKLMGFERGNPVLQAWYRNFDPYSMPGGVGGTILRGGFYSPDDYGVLGVLENMSSFGARLDLDLLPGLSTFAVGEFGSFKSNNANFTILSGGLRYMLAKNTDVSLSYSAFNVDGGSVTHTSGSSGSSSVATIAYTNSAIWALYVRSSW